MVSYTCGVIQMSLPSVRLTDYFLLPFCLSHTQIKQAAMWKRLLGQRAESAHLPTRQRTEVHGPKAFEELDVTNNPRKSFQCNVSLVGSSGGTAHS